MVEANVECLSSRLAKAFGWLQMNKTQTECALCSDESTDTMPFLHQLNYVVRSNFFAALGCDKIITKLIFSSFTTLARNTDCQRNDVRRRMCNCAVKRSMEWHGKYLDYFQAAEQLSLLLHRSDNDRTDATKQKHENKMERLVCAVSQRR